MDQRPVVVVIGASGFIGRYVVERLVLEFRVLSFDKVPPAEKFAFESFKMCDLGRYDDLQQLEDTLKERRDEVDTVIFLAAYRDFTNEPNPKYQEVFRGFKKVVALHQQVLSSSAKFVFSASMSSLEPTLPGHRQNEATARVGLWKYPHWKIKMEQYLESLVIEQPFISLVIAAVYSDQVEIVPLYHQMKLITEKKLERFFYPAPMDRGLTYIHVLDLAELFFSIVKKEDIPPGYHRYLVGEEQPLTYEQMHRITSKVFLGREGKVVKVPKWVAAMGSGFLARMDELRGKRRFVQPWMIKFSGEHFEFDTTKVQKELGWTPRRNIHDALPRILKYAKDNYQYWKEVNEKRPW